MLSYLLFVDIETSGKPPTLDTPIDSTHLWPYVIQIAWQLYDKNGNCLYMENHFIHDNKISIDRNAMAIHGISKDLLEEKGEQRKKVMIRLNKLINKYSPVIVGHYIDFDIKMIEVAMYRAGLKNKVAKLNRFCTMHATSEYTRFPNQHYPQLSDLYLGLFGEKLLNSHNAATDVDATAKCFFKLVELGQIDIKSVTRQKKGNKKHIRTAKSGCLPLILIMIISMWTIYKVWM